LDLRVQKLTAKDFKMIYDLHFDDLRRYLTFRSGDQDLSGDIAQNIFMKVWTKKIKLEKGSVKSLLFKMATDDFISHLRREKLKNQYTESLDLRWNQEVEADEDLEDKKIRLQKALNQLSEKQKTALLMNKMQGLTHKEIAEILNLSEKAIEKRIRLALENLKQNLKVS